MKEVSMILETKAKPIFRDVIGNEESLKIFPDVRRDR